MELVRARRLPSFIPQHWKDLPVNLRHRSRFVGFDGIFHLVQPLANRDLITRPFFDRPLHLLVLLIQSVLLPTWRKRLRILQPLKLARKFHPTRTRAGVF